MPRRAALAALILLALAPALACADGDPASDILLASSVFYPYQPPVSALLSHRLDAVTAQAARAGAPVKVALIASATDLGVIPQLLGKPQQYADFLDQEISFEHRQPLLVVMADGYGTASLPPAARAAVSRLPRPAGRTSDALAQAALSAVQRIAAAEGHPLRERAESGALNGNGAGRSPSTGGSSTGLVVLLLALAAASAAAAVAVARRRRG